MKIKSVFTSDSLRSTLEQTKSIGTKATDSNSRLFGHCSMNKVILKRETQPGIAGSGQCLDV